MTDQIAAVRTFAEFTEQAAQILHCSYADAAIFLVKLGPFLVLWNDRDFRAKLQAYAEALSSPPAPTEVHAPDSRGVH